MANEAIYALPSDRVDQNATVTIQTGTDPGDPHYAPSSLFDGNPAKVAKILSTTAAWMWAFAQRQRVRMAFFIHGTFGPECALRFQGNDTNSWGSPTLDVEIPVEAWHGSGVGRWPKNQWTGDLTLEPGYTDAGFFYYRLVCTGNAQSVWLGETFFSPVIRRMDPDLRWGFVPTLRKRAIVNETAYGSETTHSRRTTQVLLQGDQRMTEALFVAQREHFYDSDGIALPWPLVPMRPIGPDTDDVDERECYLVKWLENDFATTHDWFSVIDRRFMVKEVSRGLRPGV